MFKAKVLFVDLLEQEVEAPTTTYFIAVPRVGDTLVIWTNYYLVVRVDLEAMAEQVTVYVRSG